MWYKVLTLLLLISIGGCKALLPRGQSGARTTWPSFEAARETFDRIELGKTRKGDLTNLGIDPATSANIAVLTYADVMRRFVPSAAIAAEDIHPGIRECISAKEKCSAYELDIKSIKKQRSGNFWLDSFNFKRHTDINGWRFNGIIVMKDDLVVYKLHGGQPRIQEAEETRNPLGPFQGIAEGALRGTVQ